MLVHVWFLVSRCASAASLTVCAYQTNSPFTLTTYFDAIF